MEGRILPLRKSWKLLIGSPSTEVIKLAGHHDNASEAGGQKGNAAVRRSRWQLDLQELHVAQHFADVVLRSSKQMLR